MIFTVDDEAGMGRKRLGNAEVLDAAARNPDVLIPFASVDPHKGKLAVREAREWIERGARGFKFHPNTQAFWPNDRAFYPLYSVIEEAGLIALFHSGTTGIGAGMPGGGGVRLKYSNPMAVDDVAADFGGLNIILAHPSFPWQDEALAIAVHKPNVYIDLSGWSPKYFPEILVRYTNTLLKHKMLFGSDYPLITPDRWLRDFETHRHPRRGAAARAQRERGAAARAMSDLSWPVVRAARLYGGEVAVVDGERSVTYGELARRVRALGGLDAQRVGYLGPNSLAHMECWLGLPAFGKVLVDLNYRLSVDELAFMVAGRRSSKR